MKGSGCWHGISIPLTGSFVIVLLERGISVSLLQKSRMGPREIGNLPEAIQLCEKAKLEFDPRPEHP